MKIIHFDRKPVALIVLAAFIALLCFWSGPLPSATGSKQGPAASQQKDEAHGLDFIEREKKGEPTVKKHKKFPWWLAVAGGAVVVGVLVYLLAAKESDDEPENEDIGVRRVVLAEQFTSTSESGSPGAAMGLNQLKDENPATLAVIAYHHSFDKFFDNYFFFARSSYYEVGLLPDIFFDGVERLRGGNPTYSLYPTYKRVYDRRAAILSPLEFKVLGQGGNTVRVEMRNVSNRNIAGNFHFMIVEDDIPFNWQNQNMLRFVCRSILTGWRGEAVSLAAGETKAVTRTYHIISGEWNRANCRIVAFLQGADKEIYQGIEANLPN